jgi:ATP-binding cassette subfamily B protein RaxB
LSFHFGLGNKMPANNMISFSSLKSVPLILQAEIAECGLASMAMVASFLWSSA